jgi:hypothetical protein
MHTDEVMKKLIVALCNFAFVSQTLPNLAAKKSTFLLHSQKIHGLTISLSTGYHN